MYCFKTKFTVWIQKDLNMYYRNDIWLVTVDRYGLSSGRMHTDDNTVAVANLVTSWKGALQQDGMAAWLQTITCYLAFFVEFYTVDNDCNMLCFFEVLETNCPVTPRHIQEGQYPLPHCHENINTHGMWQALPTAKNNLLGEFFQPI